MMVKKTAPKKTKKKGFLANIEKGGLHKSMGVPAGKKMTTAEKVKASKSKDPKIAAQGRLALAMSKWDKKKTKKKGKK